VTVLHDAQILAAMAARPEGIMTYVIRNILDREHGYRGLKTADVRRRLMKLERQGIVARVASSYAVQLCWKIIR
jgi:hypothetical protein